MLLFCYLKKIWRDTCDNELTSDFVLLDCIVIFFFLQRAIELLIFAQRPSRSVCLQGRRAEEWKRERPGWKMNSPNVFVGSLLLSDLITPQSVNTYNITNGMLTLNSMFWCTSLPWTIHFVHFEGCLMAGETHNQLLASWAHYLILCIYMNGTCMLCPGVIKSLYVFCLPPLCVLKSLSKRGWSILYYFLWGASVLLDV